MRSKIFSSKNIMTAFKSKPWLPLFIAVGFVLAFPVAELVVLGQWQHLHYTAGQMEVLYENLWRDGFVLTGMVMAMAAAFINGASSFWYLYSKRKVDFYHSLPLTRKQIFLQQAFAGVIFYVVPYVIMEFFAVCIGASRGFFSLGLMGMAVKLMIFHLLDYFLIYFCTVLVLSMTGNILMGILCFFGIMFYFPALSWILNGYGETFYSNYYYLQDGILGALCNYFSPLFVQDRFLEMYRDGEAGVFLFLGLLLVGVVFAVAAFLAFEKRPLEKTGHALVYSWSEPVVRFMVVIPAGLGIGLFAYVAPTGGHGVVWAVAGAVFGIVMIHGILESFYHFDFRCFFCRKIHLIVSFVAVAAVVFIFKTDLTGYETYIPDYEKIESIAFEFYDVNGSEAIPYICKTEDGKYEEKNAKENDPGTFIIIEKTPEMYEILTKIAREEPLKKGEDGCYLPVRFETGFGRKIYRQYTIDSSQCRALMEEVHKDSDYIAWKYGFLDVGENYKSSFTLTGGSAEVEIIKENEEAEFLENLRKDLKDADSKTFTELPCSQLYYDYGMLPSTEKPDQLIAGKESKISYNGSVYLYPGFKRTVAFLKEKGYSLFEGIADLEYADVYYTKENKEDGMQDMVIVRYEEKQQLKELEQAIVPQFFMPGWVERENIQVEMTYMADGLSYGNYPVYGGMGYVLKEKVPDFILEDSAKVQEGLLESNIPLE
ncbi:MAG: DUF6449 domain-containing protein [Eubacteriales bacterium]|nr:DUF6449 domain-containing protein [Eubacteriales bacterium]